MSIQPEVHNVFKSLPQPLGNIHQKNDHTWTRGFYNIRVYRRADRQTDRDILQPEKMITSVEFCRCQQQA